MDFRPRQGAGDGIIGRVMFGVFLDVTPRKQAEDTREMLAAEMSHRVKNLFAIAAALTAIAARSAATTTEMARDLTQRLTALGRNSVAGISGMDALIPAIIRFHAIRTDLGRPSSSIRFRAFAAMAASVA